jgi:hypothetical protein
MLEQFMDENSATDKLSNILEGLKSCSIFGTLFFNKPANLHLLASSAFRGMLGHALCRYEPASIKKYFKPGHQGHLPSAFVVQSTGDLPNKSDQYEFRINTWTKTAEFADILMKVLPKATGMPFGSKDIIVSKVTVSKIENPDLSTEIPHGDIVELLLLTPLRIKHSGKILNESSLTLQHIAYCLSERINSISKHYGNGESLDEKLTSNALSDAAELKRQTKWYEAKRNSSSQDMDLSLSGVLGTIQYANIGIGLKQLISSGDFFHLGRHASAGCGHLKIRQGY